MPTFLTLAAANTVVNLASHPTAGRTARPDEVEKVTFATGQKGERITAPTTCAPRRPPTGSAARWPRSTRNWDVLLTPGLATVPVKLGWIDMMLDDVDEYWRRVFAFSPFTVWFNLTGQPAMMLPLGVSPEGLPVAVQCVARFGDEATLFRLAAQLESARPVDRARRPRASRGEPTGPARRPPGGSGSRRRGARCSRDAGKCAGRSRTPLSACRSTNASRVFRRRAPS